MHLEGKLKWKSHNTSYCLIEVVTKAGITVPDMTDRQMKQKINPGIYQLEKNGITVNIFIFFS